MKRYKQYWITENQIGIILRDERAINAVRKRKGLTRHPIHYSKCGCHSHYGWCGGSSYIERRTTIPTEAECVALLKKDNILRKPPRIHYKKDDREAYQKYLEENTCTCHTKIKKAC